MLGFIGRLFSWTKRKIKIKQVVRISKEDAKKMRAQEEARGYADGRAASDRIARRKAEAALKRKKEINISKLASERATGLFKQQFGGSLSLKKLFEREQQTGLFKKKKKVTVYSYNFKRKFGDFHDIGVLPDGRLTVVIKNKGHVSPIITGSTVKDLFRNFSGLKNMVDKGLAVNLDEGGGFMQNIEELDVPDVLLDADGNIVVTTYNQDAFIRKLADLRHRINSLVERNRTLESLLADSWSDVNISEIGRNLNMTRAETAESSLKKALHEAKGIILDYDNLLRESAKTDSARKTVEEINDQIDKAKDKFYKEIEKKFPRDKRDELMAETRKFTEWGIDTIKAAASITKELPQPEMKVLPPIKIKEKGEKEK